MINGVDNKAIKNLQGLVSNQGEIPVLLNGREVKDLSKEDYLKVLDKLKGRDRIGVTGVVFATSLAGAGSIAAAGTIASVAGATTFLVRRLWERFWAEFL
jgi:hypothetical protein